MGRVFESQKDERLLRTIINMAHDLDLGVIAEGVENEAQLEWLKKAGCTKVQGFFLSKPAPWSQWEKVLKERQ